MLNVKKLTAIFFAVCIAPSIASAANVEVYLLDKLDGNLNHYCIDMTGFQERADVNANLQTHTCYSYQEELAMDQTMDTSDIENGAFKVLGFDVCMTIHGTRGGSTIGVSECDGKGEQHFELTENRQIIPASAPSMCLTAGVSSWAGG